MSEFVVDLGKLELPDDVARELDRDIRRAVLDKLARADFKGDLRWKLPPGTRGIIIDPGSLESVKFR